uniref:glycosyltransferase family 2 protein n=1 Tax=Flavobacterium sp. TaxID=239 RepID=UPI00404A116D
MILNPIVSIVIPVYKVEKYISRCLDSILNQTFQDFEIILVNDASPDDSRAIAERYAKDDKRIRIIDNKENLGAAWSRMVGYSNALGDYIVFYDPDDFVPEDALEVLYRAMMKDDAVDICIGNYQRVFPDGAKSKIHENKLKYGNDKWGVAKSTLLYETPHYLWNKMFKASLFNNADIIAHKNFSKSSDEYLFFQVLQNCEKVTNVNKVVYYYFDNIDSSSYNKSNVNAMNAMVTSLNYVDTTYKEADGFKILVQKWKTNRYIHLLRIAHNDKALLKILFNNKIDYLFTPWNLFINFSKRNSFKVFLTYLKVRFINFL